MFLKCGTLIKGNGEVLENALVEVREGIIASISKEARSLKYEAVDLQDLYVLPGLIDCHDHLGLDPGDEKAQSVAPLPEICIRGVKNAKTILDAGITTLRDAGEKEFLDIDWRNAIEECLIPGPRLLISGKPIMRTGGHGWFLGREADGADDVRKAVREQLKAGVDFIKVMIGGGMTTENSRPTIPEMTREEIFALVEEAHKANKKVLAHIHGGIGADMAIDAGVDSIEHGVYLDRSQLIAMKDKGIFLVITWGIIQFYADSDDVPKFTKTNTNACIDRYREVLKTAKSVGVDVAIGADGFHGHPAVELAALCAAGFSAEDALKAATSNAAKLCGIDTHVGNIEPGKRADLIAVSGNPLDDITSLNKVQFICKAGEIYKSFL